MGGKIHFELRADFSAVIGESKIIASNIAANGEAVLLAVSPEFEKAAFGREERKGSAIFPFSKANPHYPATFIRFDGRKVLQRTELAEVELAFPFVQSLPDGDVLLVGARCHYRDGDPEKNAVVFSGEGKTLRRFVMGDGINSVQTTEEGMIWASYFDEGVFGNYGWNEPMGAPGLICFDSAGHILWEFSPPAGFDTICDCYAMNVMKNAIWACYYTDFPLVKIDSKKQVQGWRNEVGGASALAVDGGRAVLWGGYGEKSSRCVVQDFGSEALVRPREIEIGLPSGLKLKGARIIGRDSAFHSFSENAWLTFDIGQIA